MATATPNGGLRSASISASIFMLPFFYFPQEERGFALTFTIIPSKRFHYPLAGIDFRSANTTQKSRLGNGSESKNERSLKEKDKNQKAFKEEKKWRGVADRRLQAANGGTVTRRII
jgi:hypothetical protein